MAFAIRSMGVVFVHQVLKGMFANVDALKEHGELDAEIIVHVKMIASRAIS
jgi:hypothetical protein